MANAWLAWKRRWTFATKKNEVFLSLKVFIMSLSNAQLAILKADIIADPILSAQPNNSDGASVIAGFYNILAVPDFWAWRTSMTKAEYVQSAGPDGTTFIWVGNGFITRSVGERDAWRELFNGDQACNPSLSNVRAAFGDIFSGAGNAAANLAHLIAMSRRKIKRAEKLFATGTGTTVAPAIMTFEGDLSYQDIEQARNLP